LQPLDERFEFRDHEWMEISELPEEVAPISEAIAGTRRAASVLAQNTPAAQPVPAQPRETTIGEELQVFAALHRVGADLGDPIEVTRERNRILVAGVGIAPQRQEQIHKALDAVPNVVVRFSEPTPVTGSAVTGQPGPANPPSKTGSLQFQARIEQQIGGRQNFEQFSSQLLDMTDSMMSRTYALRRLADRFTKDVEVALSPDDRKILQNLNREHAAAIKQQASQIERLLTPVLVPLGAPSNGGSKSGIRSNAWQPATEELFQNAKKVETLLAVMLGVTPGNPDAHLPSEVLLSVAQLRASSDVYEQLAIQEPGGK
jgi:hypothetical protein